jgi:hypothetical protein
LGFINDIDGGLPFWPDFIDQDKNEMYSWFHAYEIINYLDFDYTHRDQHIDTVAYQRLRQLVKNLKTTNNPVIVKVTGMLK